MRATIKLPAGEMQNAADGENHREECAALLHVVSLTPVGVREAGGCARDYVRKALDASHLTTCSIAGCYTKQGLTSGGVGAVSGRLVGFFFGSF